MLKSDKLEFEGGAATKAEHADRGNGQENRHHDRDGTAGSRKSPASSAPVEDLSKDSLWGPARPVATTWARRLGNDQQMFGVSRRMADALQASGAKPLLAPAQPAQRKPRGERSCGQAR